jgi:hypothetical protein
MPTFALPVIVALAVVLAFAAGRYVGEQDAKRVSEIAMRNLDASRNAEAFSIVSSAREALKNSEPANAELVLTRYAALKAPALIECSQAASCTAWVAGLMPKRERLEEILAAARSLKDAQ